MSQLAIPWDNVDEEEIARPVKWQTKGLARFAFIVGPVSSVFDIITFLVLWYVFWFNTVAHANLFWYARYGKPKLVCPC